jgi:U4/U6.U5 tri-snRNP-associated protein 1
MEQISLSVEETNKLRLSLGLAPLKETEPEKSITVQQVTNVTNVTNDINNEEFKSNLNQNIKTLGKGKLSSTLEWINKQPKPSRAKKLPKQVPKDEKGDSNIFKLQHSIDELKEDAILTLKDTLIYDEEMELQDVTLKTKKKTKKLTKYEQYERELQGKSHEILEKYNQESADFIYLENNKISAKPEPKSENPDKPYETLKLNLKIQEDYTEELHFKKPRKKKVKQFQYKKEYQKNEFSNYKSVENVNFVDDDYKVQVYKPKKKEFLLDVSEGESEDGIVIDSLSEFVSTINPKQEDEIMSVVEDSIGQETMEDDSKSVVKDEIKEEGVVEIEQDINEIIKEEPLVSQGMFATLKLLSKKGEIQPKTKQQEQTEKLVKSRLKWQNTKQVEGNTTDALNYEEIDKYKDYNPVVNLVYKDYETGQELSTKDAYKQISRKFHGRYGGAKKKEAKLQKLLLEKKTSTFNFDKIEKFNDQITTNGGYLNIGDGSKKSNQHLNEKLIEIIKNTTETKKTVKQVSLPKDEPTKEPIPLNMPLKREASPGKDFDAKRSKISFGITKKTNLLQKK